MERLVCRGLTETVNLAAPASKQSQPTRGPQMSWSFAGVYFLQGTSLCGASALRKPVIHQVYTMIGPTVTDVHGLCDRLLQSAPHFKSDPASLDDSSTLGADGHPV